MGIIVVYLLVGAYVMLGGWFGFGFDPGRRVGMQSVPGFFRQQQSEKRLEDCEILLENINIAKYFSIVVSGDTLPTKKPHPGPLLHAAQEFGLNIDQCLMVGDSRSDIDAAHQAGCPVVALSYGYNHGEDIRLHNPTITIDSIEELLPLLPL